MSSAHIMRVRAVVAEMRRLGLSCASSQRRREGKDGFPPHERELSEKVAAALAVAEPMGQHNGVAKFYFMTFGTERVLVEVNFLASDISFHEYVDA